MVALSVDHLTKSYRGSFSTKRVPAVTDASFSVEQGEIFGFVGPNGAGKTTTIRALLGLIRPTSGSCTVLGKTVPSREARSRLGFLAESPYFYEYLTPRELLDLVGRLHGLDAKARARRADELLVKVGLADAAARPLRKFSKGMLQRAGLAQALVNDPELLILDEPMSGLDPVGRKEVRDLIVELRAAGKTIFFSTHILPDVEAVCDRVALIVGGRIQDVGSLRELLSRALAGTEVVLDAPAGATVDALIPAGAPAVRVEHQLTVQLPADADVQQFLRAALAVPGVKIVSVTPRRESLEDLFVRRMREAKREAA
jgi:ABC-2 type transport system ATP-binding protein